MSWLNGYRRLNHRYERHPRNYLAFLGLAAALCCCKRLVRLTTQDTVQQGNQGCLRKLSEIPVQPLPGVRCLNV